MVGNIAERWRVTRSTEQATKGEKIEEGFIGKKEGEGGQPGSQWQGFGLKGVDEDGEAMVVDNGEPPGGGQGDDTQGNPEKSEQPVPIPFEVEGQEDEGGVGGKPGRTGVAEDGQAGEEGGSGGYGGEAGERVNKLICQRVRRAKRYPKERVRPPPTTSQSKAVGKKVKPRVAKRTWRGVVSKVRLSR